MSRHPLAFLDDPALIEQAGPRCGEPAEYDRGCRCALCRIAHAYVMARYWIRRREAEGRPLSAWQAQVKAEDEADADGRLFYKAHRDGESWWVEEWLIPPPARLPLAAVQAATVPARAAA